MSDDNLITTVVIACNLRLAPRRWHASVVRANGRIQDLGEYATAAEAQEALEKELGRRDVRP
jgi:hypothetical protein